MKNTRDTTKMESGAIAQEASEVFIQCNHGDWTADDQARLETRLAGDAEFAEVFRGMEKSWRSIGAHAESAELMKLRQCAIAWIRRENVKRWSSSSNTRAWVWGAAASIAAVALGLALQLSPYGYHPGLYSTRIGQQSKVDLADRSQVELDAATRLQVKFSETARTVRLLEGQAQFSIAKDSTRPFTVLAGDRAIVALGTVFTVEYLDGKVHVAMLEGKVYVSPTHESASDKAVGGSRSSGGGVALTAGEELRVASDEQGRGQCQW